MHLGLVVSLLLAAEPPVAPGDEAMRRYFEQLERTRRLPAETVSEESLRAALAKAENLLVRGDARAATTLLYGIVESPRYEPWKDTASYQNAEFLLGRAASRGGAHASAERYLGRVLARGTGGAYFVPAHRAMVDIALDTRQYARLAGRLADAAGPGAAGSLPSDARSELSYLQGRVAYEQRDFAGAATHFSAVERSSRLYPGAAYFRGLLAARARRWDEAKQAFCEIADQPDKGRLAFHIDGRYFALKDLARLALGRVAHEQDRYDEAYYHYFSIPEDSERLAEALFEAAWSMYGKGEVEAGRAFADQFEKLFPRSPLAPEVAILQANLDLKLCAFGRARDRIAALTARYGRLLRAADRALGSPARRRELFDRLLGRTAALGHAADLDGELLALLKLDRRFADVHGSIRGIDRDIAEATTAVRLWRALGQQARSDERLLPAPSSAEAALLLDQVQSLESEAVNDSEVAGRFTDLLIDVSLLAHPPETAGPFAAEARAAESLARRLGVLRTQLIEAAQALAEEALRDLRVRLGGVLGRARLAQIDAVVGRKKKLEIEIANLQAGKLPPALYYKLLAEGALADDEEYWPFEGEFWADEYLGFK